jgi:hypothetical protein
MPRSRSSIVSHVHLDSSPSSDLEFNSLGKVCLKHGASILMVRAPEPHTGLHWYRENVVAAPHYCECEQTFSILQDWEFFANMASL